MAIVNPTIVELSEKVDCRYTLVVEASKRARQLLAGAQPMIDAKDMKPLKLAVEEINRGLLTYSRDPDMEE
ncbi:MAG TPA: DNA-directed RNA polymerase subunit omega [Candidatus Limiplasma sp.]|nr:DNA-directed RNA polymerase subunit omega [Candidatus Limiplasma sp.]HPS82325.1 DNA-directed RNA polymerase subunit omega [Candidatus Limiplasma sp.]